MEEQKDFLEQFPGEWATVKRSEIHPAEYNPRKIGKEAKKALKRSIKTFGVLGGIVVNKQTGNTIVGGHQKVYILDEKYNYPENDYMLKVEVIDVDEKTEKTINAALNNVNMSGEYDYDALAAIMPDINYKDAGFTDADLSLIGLDYLYKTEEQNNISEDLSDLMSGVQAQHDAEVQQRAEERAAEREAIKEASRQAEQLAQQEMSREERVQHMKDVKRQVQEQAMENAQNMDAYLVLSFDTFNAKAAFCQRFGYQPMERMIKGEDFDSRCEAVMDDYDEDE